MQNRTLEVLNIFSFIKEMMKKKSCSFISYVDVLICYVATLVHLCYLRDRNCTEYAWLDEKRQHCLQEAFALSMEPVNGCCGRCLKQYIELIENRKEGGKKQQPSLCQRLPQESLNRLDFAQFLNIWMATEVRTELLTHIQHTFDGSCQ